MGGTTARNVAIVLALAAVVAFVPGGGSGADLLSQLLSAVFIAAFVVIFARLYRQFRGDLFGLGDRWRAILYVSLAVLVLTLAASRRLFDGGPGTAAWFLLVAAGSYGLFATWRHFRSYA